MAIYRFRVTFEENDEIFRDIDIKSTQNFEDFHLAILKAIKFEDGDDASFFISDDYWVKGAEIVLKATPDKKRLMKQCTLASLIDDPHQKFLYVYNPQAPWEFYVELMKIVSESPTVEYPTCVKSVGDAPLKNKAPLIIGGFEDDDDFEDDIADETDDDAYDSATSEEFDLADLDDIDIQDAPEEGESEGE
jgi:Plasmid pRiA4b ORF-3-like protein